ncbi:hypothetical protein LguiA_029816 [Lonicera macranthoides]
MHLSSLIEDSSLKSSKPPLRTGYLQEVEKMLKEKLPRCGLKASPNIESRFVDGTFDAIVDKGGLYAVMEPELGPKLGSQYLSEDRATGEGAIDPIGEEDNIRANIYNISENDDDINASEGIEVSSTEKHHTSSISRTKGRKRAKTLDGYSSSLGEIETSFKTFVQSTNENIDKLANAICMNHETELGKKVVESLKSIDGLTRADVIKAASMIIGDTKK